MKYTEVSFEKYLNLTGPCALKPYKLVHFDGTVEYRMRFARHRVDGPAFTSPNTSVGWYIYGDFLTETEFLKTSLVGKELLSCENGN